MSDLIRRLGWEVVEHSLDGILVTAPDGRILAANPAACDILRRTEAEIVAAGRAGLVDPDDPNVAAAVEERRRTGRTTRDIGLVRGDGSIVLCELSSSIFVGPDGEELTAMSFRDVTERRALEQQLRESEQRFRLLAEAAYEGIGIHSDGVIVAANAALEALLGYPQGGIVGLSIPAIIAPAALDRVAAAIEAGATLYDVDMLRTDGSTFTAELSARSISWNGRPARVAAVRDVSAQRDAENERVGLLAREAELRRIQSLAVLAGGVAHEFNNTLQAILASAELAQRRSNEGAAVGDLLAGIVGSVGRATQLAGSMLAYSGRHGAAAGPVDLPRVADEVVSAFRSEHPGLDVAFQAWPAVEVDGDRSALAELIELLLDNASDAVAERGAGRIDVQVGWVALAADAARAAYPTGELPAGRYAFVEVSDTGTGMDENARAHMFDPYFSTKFPGRGLSLGAGLGIARRHRGGFLVESAPGTGTAIRVLLPASEDVPS